jgi:hypothetical protein
MPFSPDLEAITRCFHGAPEAPAKGQNSGYSDEDDCLFRVPGGVWAVPEIFLILFLE